MLLLPQTTRLRGHTIPIHARWALTFAAGTVLPATGCGPADAPASVEPGAGVQRVELEPQPRSQAAPSPDTSQAGWTVSADAQAIAFGNAEAVPFLTLTCVLDQPEPHLTITRHAPAFPGQGALFPVIGNGVNARFMADAVLADGDWRWEAQVEAADPRLDVFGGRRDIIATLPGHGTLEIAGDRIPGDFVDWCRSGGNDASALDRAASGD